MPPDSDFSRRLLACADRLVAHLDHFERARVLVVGDLTLDEFVNCYVERISREAPVPIIRHEHTRQVPGGGANAIYNLAKLGAKVTAAGLVGTDAQGAALRSLFEDAHIDTAGLVAEGDRPTVTKSRISAHSRQSVTQQIVRIDRKSDDPPQAEILERLAAFVRSRAADADAVVCSDYGDGTFTAETIAAALTGTPCIVDAQNGLDRYRGATWFTPNLPEAERAVGYRVETAADLLRAGQDLLALTAAEFILITRGDEGMSLFGRDGTVDHIPAFNRAEVYDVTGAGDTVVAGLTLCLAAGGSPWEAAVLGNLAASLVVRQMGTATTSVTEMRDALDRLLRLHQAQMS